MCEGCWGLELEVLVVVSEVREVGWLSGVVVVVVGVGVGLGS